MLDDKKVVKRFRVIVLNYNQRIRGMRRGEVFEAEWPDEWLERRIESHHIELVEEPEPKPRVKKAAVKKPIDTKKED